MAPPFTAGTGSTPDVIKQIYIYLLLATRANMKTERIQSDEDGALLFEELSEICIAFQYLLEENTYEDVIKRYRDQKKRKKQNGLPGMIRGLHRLES